MPSDDSLVSVVIIGAAIAALLFYNKKAEGRSITTADDQAERPVFNPSVTVIFPDASSDNQSIVVGDDTYGGTGAVYYDADGNIVYDDAVIAPINVLDDNMFTSPIYNTTDFPSDISQNGLQAIMTREGYSDVPYVDAGGYSIGYGHFIKADEKATLTHVTPAQAADLLMADSASAVQAVLSALDVPITQNAFDALVSFAYNVGNKAFANSTLIRKINSGDPTASDEFMQWIYAHDANGNKYEVAALRDSRRPSEQQQFLS